VLRGAYHFFRPQQDGTSQARYFLAQLTDPGELQPVLDVEVADGVSPVAIVNGIDAWLEIVTASMRRPIIYTSPSFWKSLPSIASIASKADLWLAAWGEAAPGAVNGWQSWTFWQHTNKGGGAGIAGLVDRDRFNGSVDGLQAYGAQVRGEDAGLRAAESSKVLSASV
jgi:lysozyme